jgi:hypothetical protein
MSRARYHLPSEPADRLASRSLLTPTRTARIVATERVKRSLFTSDTHFVMYLNAMESGTLTVTALARDDTRQSS